MEIREYLYVDDRRLDAYLDQIGPPVTYDKVPIWRTEIGLTGPKAGATQERRGRPLTQHEKVETLLEHLTTSGLVYDSRPVLTWHNDTVNQFVLENCSAVRVEVPARLHAENSAKKLSLWVSLPNSEDSKQSEAEVAQPGILCLLEDFRYSDKAPFDGHRPSAYSVLWSITWSLRDEMSDLVIGDQFSSVKNEDSWRNRLDAWHGSHHHIEDFIMDPIASLTSWGCIPGPIRSIRTLYRIREYGPEYGDRSDTQQQRFRRSISVFGYPIVIMETEVAHKRPWRAS